MKTLRLGTRKSALAQAQARWTADQLRAAFPDLHVEIVLITTSGDQQSAVTPTKVGAQSNVLGSGFRRNDNVPKGGLKALFTREIEEALLDRRIDLAVHSLKDMPAELPGGLIIGAVPEREDPRDAWISRTKCPFGKIPAEAKIGTGAVRRQAQLKRLRPDFEIIPIRGNVETRLKKLFLDVTPAEAGAQSNVLGSGFRRNDETASLDGIVLARPGSNGWGIRRR